MVGDQQVNEKDKPFILALVASGITVLNIVITAIGAATHNQEMTAQGMETLKFTFPLTMAAWTYYFGKKE